MYRVYAGGVYAMPGLELKLRLNRVRVRIRAYTKAYDRYRAEALVWGMDSNLHDTYPPLHILAIGLRPWSGAL